MNRVFIKVIILFMLVSVMLTMETLAFSWQDVFTKSNDFIRTGREGGTQIAPNEMSDFVIPLARGMIVIASIVLLVVTIIMAIKYMMASPDGRAKLKIQLIGLVVSTIVIYGAQFIWALVYRFMINVTTT